MRHAQISIILGGLCLLSACGGGGSHGGGGGGGGGGNSSYTIGGTVSGLTASGLVLQDNGGDSLSVPANASTFTFATAVAAGGNYAVTIQTQPTGEKCVLVNGSGTAKANVSSVAVSCGNSVGMNVAPGPASTQYQTFNIPLVSVTVCVPNSNANQCATIPNVLVDTGSSGLRLMKSVLAATGITLPALNDPAISANTIHECGQFVDGYTWGAVDSAVVVVAGEETSKPVQVQVIDDGSSPSPAAPSSGCVQGSSLNSVNAFDANGVLGVGVFDQDCGTDCSQKGSHIYFTCTSSGTCSATTLATADQVSNPVVSFANDNAGVVVQLPGIPAAGQAGANGTLTFGIGTESDNALGTATVLTANNAGDFTTNFNGDNPSPPGVLDSGSNAYFFADSSLPLCAAPASAFYCPTSTQTLTATNQGTNGTPSAVTFQIANLNNINNSFYAINDVGGPMTGTFDWGLPFFYGRSTFILFEGTKDGGTYGAYAY